MGALKLRKGKECITMYNHKTTLQIIFSKYFTNLQNSLCYHIH